MLWRLITFSQCRCGDQPQGALGGDDLDGLDLPCKLGFYRDPWQEEVRPEATKENVGLPRSAIQQAQVVPQGWVDVQAMPVLPEAVKGKQEDSDFDGADACLDTAEFSTLNTSSASKEVSPNRVKSSPTHPSRARSLGDRGQAHHLFASAAHSRVRDGKSFAEAADGFKDFEESHIPGVSTMQWQGRCGFVVRLRPDVPPGPWMCHHFALDGTHCVAYGHGKQHANRCAGVLYPINAEGDAADHPRGQRRCMGLRKPGDGTGYPILVRCGRPASAPACRPDNCPYVARQLLCPYAARAAEAGGLAEAHAPAASTTDTASCTTAATAPMSDSILAQPEPDSDFSPMHTPRVAGEPSLGPLPPPFLDVSSFGGAGGALGSPGYSTISPVSPGSVGWSP